MAEKGRVYWGLAGEDRIMCEANAYMSEDGREVLLLESVDLVEPLADGRWRLLSIFGEQELVKGRIKRMNLADHRLIFEPESQARVHRERRR